MRRCIVIFLVSLYSFGYAQEEIPKVWNSHIEDGANILTPQFENQLELLLKQYEDSTSNQIAILTVASLNGVPIEDYALQVAERFGLGQADKDNGVLLLVAYSDRKVRIEVGEGLEGVLPDAICNQIIRNEIAPRFRQDDYQGGIGAAVLAMTQAIGGEYDADQGPATKRGRRGGSLWGTLIIIAIFILISKMGGGRGGHYRGGTWIPGGFGGGFGRGGGFGGGGFSGGGGGFSGGGSSGSW